MGTQPEKSHTPPRYLPTKAAQGPLPAQGAKSSVYLWPAQDCGFRWRAFFFFFSCRNDPASHSSTPLPFYSTLASTPSREIPYRRTSSFNKYWKGPMPGLTQGTGGEQTNQTWPQPQGARALVGKRTAEWRKACGITKRAADPRESGPSPDAEDKLTGWKEGGNRGRIETQSAETGLFFFF